MELETLIIAKQVIRQLEVFRESIQHLDELVDNVKKGVKYNISITTNDGWGMQRFEIPVDAIQEVLPIIRDSLVMNVEKLEQKFKEL